MRQLANKRRIVLIALAVLASPVVEATAQSEPAPCARLETFSGSDYWLWEGYLGVTHVTETEHEVRGRLKHDTKACFRAPRDEVEAISARSEGYKLALAEWVKWLPKETEAWYSNPQALMARQRLSELTGLELSSRAEWQEWMKTNTPGLRYSATEGLLVYSRDPEAAACHRIRETSEIDARDYWFLSGRGWLEDLREEGGVLEGRAWRPPHGHVRIRIATDRILDADAKLEGLVLAARSLIFDGIALSYIEAGELQRLIRRLEAITDQRFWQREEWLQWWKENGNRLTLSEDGERLQAAKR